MTRIYDVHSYKGGVGVTTTACSIACESARQGNRTLLIETTGTNDIHAWLSDVIPSPMKAVQHQPTSVENLDAISVDNIFEFIARFIPSNDYDVFVIDAGSHGRSVVPSLLSKDNATFIPVCVVRNDYLTLRRTVDGYDPDTDILVSFIYPDAALNANDIGSVLRRKPISEDMNPAVQRAIDAGLPTSRPHLFGWAEKVLAVSIETQSQ